jgi:hypothetical protein
LTAEIAIMNKEAIALAADSAVTMREEKGQKIFSSANKLFALSKFWPVGIMIYGNASLMGVPWETIIKMYRRKLGDKGFATLKEYAADFVSFLDNGNTMFPEKQQEEFLFRNAVSFFEMVVKADIKEQMESLIEKNGKISEKEVEILVSNIIRNHAEGIEKAPALPYVQKDHCSDIAKKYAKLIDKARKIVFEKLPVLPDLEPLIRTMIGNLLCKDIFPSDISGIVIAGFGEEDSFPTLKTLDIHGIVNDKLRYKEKEPLAIDFKNSVRIIPFAQHEMVVRFMEGIDPKLKDVQIKGYLPEIFDKYPDIIVDNIDRYNAEEKKKLKEKLKGISRETFKHFLNQFQLFIQENYIVPIVRVVEMLPKDELSAMAESLVALTSFKRKVSMGPETVAGPIDVAVISKGDGFVWIKRKHYFKQELNPQFFSNYNRR